MCLGYNIIRHLTEDMFSFIDSLNVASVADTIGTGVTEWSVSIQYKDYIETLQFTE